MAMARLVSLSLHHHRRLPRILAHHRHGSSKAHTTQFIEIDLDPSSSSSASTSAATSDVDASISKLEEVIQGMIVRRAAPDWLPFLPGASYWVPATPFHGHPYGGVVEVIGRLSSRGKRRGKGSLGISSALSGDETMSLGSHRGWPSSSYFIQGDAPSYAVPMVVGAELDVKTLVDSSENVSHDTDEEE